MPTFKNSQSGLRGALLRGLVAALLIFGATASAISQDRQACAVSENFANPKLLAAMRRGVNLPGWDNPDESRRPSLAQLQALRDKGFTHVRLLLDDSHLSGDGQAAYLDQMFEQIIFLLSLAMRFHSIFMPAERSMAIRLKPKNISPTRGERSRRGCGRSIRKSWQSNCSTNRRQTPRPGGRSQPG